MLYYNEYKHSVEYKKVEKLSIDKTWNRKLLNRILNQGTRLLIRYINGLGNLNLSKTKNKVQTLKQEEKRSVLFNRRPWSYILSSERGEKLINYEKSQVPL